MLNYQRVIIILHHFHRHSSSISTPSFVLFSHLIFFWAIVLSRSILMSSWQTPTTWGTWVLRGEGFSILSCCGCCGCCGFCGCCGCRAEGWFGGSLDLLGSQTRLLSGVMYCVAGVITQVWCFQFAVEQPWHSHWNWHKDLPHCKASQHSFTSWSLLQVGDGICGCLDPKSIRSYQQWETSTKIQQQDQDQTRWMNLDMKFIDSPWFTMIHQQKGGDSPSPSRRLNADHPRFARAAYKTEHGGSRAAQMPGIEADTSS